MSTEAFLFPMDYTSRDYLAIREDLITVIKSRIPEWDSTDPADFGVALVEAYAYLGDVVNYYIDRAAAETFLGTAAQRKSLLNLASLLGYVPTGRVAAQVPVTFTNNGSVPVYIKPGTQVTTVIRTGDANVPLTFEVETNPATSDGRWSVSPGGLTAVVSCTEGITAKRVSGATMIPGKVVGQSNGFPSQTFQIRDYPVINRTVSVEVAGQGTFTFVQNLYDATPTDKSFTYRTDDQGVTTIQFGDGVSGVIPLLGADVIAYYRLGGGIIGNIGKGQTFNILDSVYKSADDSSTPFIGAITNQIQATGGADEESNEHIRQSAFATFRTRNSAVTKQDFQDLAQGDNRISKAKARGNSFANMLVYVAPVSSGSPKTDPAPGYDAYAVVTASLTSNVASLTLAETPQFVTGTSVTVSGMGSVYDGVHTVTVTGNVLTFSVTHANIPSAPDSGVVVVSELTDFASVRSDIQTSLTAKGVVGTIVHVYPPRYRDVQVEVTFAVKDQFRQSLATAAVKASLLDWFSYNRMSFNEAVRPQEILSQIVNTVEEVQYATVVLKDGVGGVDVYPSPGLVQAGSDEILRLLDGNLILTVIPGTGIDA